MLSIEEAHTFNPVGDIHNSMNAKVIWKQNLSFDGQVDENRVPLDSGPPLGEGAGFTPKELVAVALAGCTGMDVAALMKKHKQPMKSFRVEANVTSTENHPVTFKGVELDFHVEGEIEKDKLVEAVKLSQTKYCGVSAMIALSAEITYRIHLNGDHIADGKAAFQDSAQ